MRSRTAARPPRPGGARAGAGGEAGDGVGERARPRRAQHAGAAGGDQLGRAARGDRDDRQPGGLRLEHHLAEGVGLRAEEEEVGVRVGARQRVALEPAEKRGGAAEPRAQRVLLGPAAGEHELQPRVARAGGEERVGEQVDALLLASAGPA